MKDVPGEERFRRLYEAAWRPVLAYALRRTPSADDAADILMETFTIAWAHLGEVPEGDGAVLWLYATARGVIANAAKRQQRRLRLSQRVAAELNETALAGAEAGPAHGDTLVATDALGLLGDDDRELLMLAAWEGLGSRELACVLNCSPAAARVRLHRARARLRAALAQVGLPTGDNAEPPASEVKEHGRNPATAHP
jgi:RNA polymerase sigma-70 factor, ECF subfamily